MELAGLQICCDHFITPSHETCNNTSPPPTPREKTKTEHGFYSQHTMPEQKLVNLKLLLVTTLFFLLLLQQ